MLLLTGLVQGSNGQGIPAFHSIIETENEEAVVTTYEILKNETPAAFGMIKIQESDL